MTTEDPDPRIEEVYSLAEVCLRGEASPEEFARLDELLRTDQDSPRYYVEYVVQSIALSNWALELGAPWEGGITDSDGEQHGDLSPSPAAGQRPRNRWTRPSAWWIGSAVAAALLVAIAVPLYRNFLNSTPAVALQPGPRVAMVASSIDSLWGGASVPDSEGWLPAGAVHLRRGQVEIRFVSGVVVALKAPAEFQAISPTEARLKQGAMSAHVDGKITSFRIHTPTAEVVDLGTEFGLAVADSGETDIAVFDGLVDVSTGGSRDKNAQGASSIDLPGRRLAAGEALRVDRHGQFRRIATITDSSFPALARPQDESEPRLPLVASVSDTLRDGDEYPMFYRVVSRGFRDDCLAFVDRNYEWNGIDGAGIPDFLLGADYIMPFNADKDKDLDITIALTQPATVYVLFDDRGTPLDWLTQAFVDTGFDIGMDEGPFEKSTHDHSLGRGPGASVDYVFSIWKCDVERPGQFVLGPRGPQSGGRSMYGIVVVPLENQ